MRMTTIVLADDHHVVRQGLRSLLEAEPDFSVVDETGDGLEAAQLVERLQPDVLVLDLMMPSLNGLEVTRQVSQRSPRTQVVILSMHANEAHVLEALRAGAAAYVLKESTSAELVQAVREAVAGRRYLSPPLSERAIEVYMQKAEPAVLDPYETLTAREREVLHLVVEGHTNAEIADRLFISRRTVETHRASFMRKLDLRTQTDLISYALRRGILPME
jgi:two-component system response regulator NreC